MMFKQFRTAAVLGAGVMGSQIAAHLANAGLTVYLLDISSKEGAKNALVEASFRKILTLKPTPFFTEKTSRRIIIGNFDEHFYRLASVDWIIEAVVENLAVKQQLMERVESVISPDTIISTNTSGLPIHQISKERSDSFRRRFLGTHFFNPPRYLKLVEVIPTVDTDTQVLEDIQSFARLHLGKGVVIAKDTPNFIANRIGIYAAMFCLRACIEEGYTIEEIDTLTGVLVGRPKSATFRTADIAGIDTLVYVAENLYPAIPHDESREMFRVPSLVRQLVDMGALGAKAGRGFYKKEGDRILSINPQTLQYEAAKPLNLGNIQALEKMGDLSDRLRALYQDSGRAGAFFRHSTLEILAYSARRIPEIADSPAEIDRGMRWGFSWPYGPFEIWDILGFESILADMKAAGISVPAWVEKMPQTGANKFYANDREVCVPDCGYLPLNAPFDEISLASLKSDSQNILWQNAEAALLNLGDGVVLYDFFSKANTMSMKVVEGLFEVLDLVENRDIRGLVIGNEGENFSVGGNLGEMAMLVKEGKTDIIEKKATEFQNLIKRIYYSSKPIVAALHGRVLGAGCELAMVSSQVVAAAESYVGLPEMGVGLIPGAGGVMGMTALASERATTELPAHIHPFLQKAFEAIATVKISNSAREAQEIGFLPAKARIVMKAERRFYVAKEEVLRLSNEGYAPPPERNAILVLGRPARALFEQMAYNFLQGGFITEYDYYLAQRLAYVMTGGDLSSPTLVHENYLFQLERETFVSLLGQPKTQERIAKLLTKNKPLKN